MAPLRARIVRRHNSTLAQPRPTCTHRTNVSRETFEMGRGPCRPAAALGLPADPRAKGPPSTDPLRLDRPRRRRRSGMERRFQVAGRAARRSNSRSSVMESEKIFDILPYQAIWAPKPSPKARKPPENRPARREKTEAGRPKANSGHEIQRFGKISEKNRGFFTVAAALPGIRLCIGPPPTRADTRPRGDTPAERPGEPSPRAARLPTSRSAPAR